MSGHGRIWSFAVPHPPLLEPFQDRAPYNVAVVELDEDPLIRVLGNVIVDAESPNLQFVDPSGLDIGDRVRAVFPRIEGEPRLDPLGPRIGADERTFRVRRGGARGCAGR